MLRREQVDTFVAALRRVTPAGWVPDALADWMKAQATKPRACRTCEFAKRTHGGIDTWSCQRRAPIGYPETTYHEGVVVLYAFPTMHGHDWCGDYAPASDNGGGNG